MSVFIATPTFDGSVCGEYMHSLLRATATVDFQVALIPGIHFVDTARDIAVAQFLATKHEHLFFIDSDVGWAGDAISQLVNHKKDIVGASYRIKDDTERYPVYLTDEIKDGLIRAIGLPGGFLCIHRSVIERLVASVPSYQWVVNGAFARVPALFTRVLVDDRMVSEDMMFGRRAMAAGYQLWFDPDVTMSHIGRRAFIGNYKEYENAQHHAGAPGPRV
jgi:hypothetical protein